jgi:YD repeat-containing protein
MAKVWKIVNTIALALIISTIASAQSAPNITSISPNPAGVGMSVQIQGTNFGSSGSVTFNGVPASPTIWNSTTIVTPVPAGAATGNVVVVVASQPSNSFPFTVNNGPVNYVYNDLGRLVGVIDILGNAATYNYDAVGNILSITRVAAGQVSIIQFSPKSGPIGSSVTVQGTGFSATASQDTVKFNGTSATVTTATTSQLQVTVPAGATSGTISVTSPNGTATSAATFTVTAGNGAPTITTFSPGSGVAGTAVTVTGTNFDPSPIIDPLQLNVSPAIISNATSTTIATTVPPATSSGHFSVLTQGGLATSSQDFYVPFGNHVVGDIGFTARMALGGSQTVSLASGKIGLVLFDAVGQQWVSVGISNSNLGQCTLYLIDPGNTAITSTSCNAVTPYLGSTYLPRTGTYTLGVDPASFPAPSSQQALLLHVAHVRRQFPQAYTIAQTH